MLNAKKKRSVFYFVETNEVSVFQTKTAKQSRDLFASADTKIIATCVRVYEFKPP
jgi:hypothetical protein